MDNPKRILIIQLKRAGDVIETTPVIPALRQALPEAQIDFLVDRPFVPLLEGHPDLHQIRIFNRDAAWKTWREIRQGSYDVILDFQSSPRSVLAGLFSGARIRAGYRVTFWGKFFTHAIKRPGVECSVTEGKMSLARYVLPGVTAAGARLIALSAAERGWAIQQMGKAQRAIGLIPTNRKVSRRWPPEAFAEAARLLIAQGHSVWWFWGPGEEDYVADIQRQVPESQMIPPTSLRQMAALLERCQAVIANSNGPMHTAVAVGIPTVTLYGPTDPRSWSPGGPRHRVVQASGVPCLGCDLNECPFNLECMTTVSAAQVVAEVQSVLKVSVGAG
jgi:ADP-heptose:LPS heptosyltransferase